MSRRVLLQDWSVGRLRGLNNHFKTDRYQKNTSLNARRG